MKKITKKEKRERDNIGKFPNLKQREIKKKKIIEKTKETTLKKYTYKLEKQMVSVLDPGRVLMP